MELNNHTHTWEKWTYDEEYHAPIRHCKECGAGQSPFAWQKVRSEPIRSSSTLIASLPTIQSTGKFTPDVQEQFNWIPDDPQQQRAHLKHPHLQATIEAKVVADIIRLFKGSDSAAKRAFVEACPPSPLKENVIQAVIQPYLEVSLSGLNLLAETYCRGQDCKLAAMLSKAANISSKQAFEENLDKSLNGPYLFVVGMSAITCATSLHCLGDHNELISMIVENIHWLDAHKAYKEYHEHKSIHMLYLAQANLDLAQFDEVEKMLDQTDWGPLPPAHKITLENLRNRFEQLARQRASELPKVQSDEETFQQLRQSIQNDLKTVDGFTSSGNWDQVKQMSEKIDAVLDTSGFSSMADWALRSQATMNELSDLMSGGGSEMSHRQNQTDIRNAGLILHDPVKGHDPQELEKSIAVLVGAIAWAKGHNLIDNQNDALWSLYICYNRTGRESAAIDVLQQLRSNLEEFRKRISDPFKRAGTLIKYPYLFGALCWLLDRNNRPAEMLDAMEGGKGRVIADVLTQKSGQIVSDGLFSGIVQQLPAAMQRAGAHYLSYFIDEYGTYAVFIAKDGSLHKQSIPIDKVMLREWAKHVDPKTWGTRPGGFQSPQIPSDLPDRLAPLVSWLEPLAEAGLLQEGDHICYCPDEELHLIPLHYVTFRGSPLVHYVSVSRIHSAYALQILLQKKPLSLQQFRAVYIPAKGDVPNINKIAAFSQASTWLKERFPGEIMSGETVDLVMIEQGNWKQQIVHFATHGTFPRDGRIAATKDPNPFSSSGLVLAHNGQLPDLNQIVTGKANSSLLTPEKVLGLDFSGSHVTMQACVSGLAKEGIGGDALGLEWAFLQAGATSLLATHWNVDATISAKFSVGFYQRWLLNKLTRAAAWRETVLELMVSHPEPYYWAGFSLSGDWR